MYPASHRDYLVEEFKRRSERNPNYSLRAYSRDIGLAASTLTEVLKGRYGLSRFKSYAVARKLNLSPHEADHFADLFQAKRVKGSQSSRDARARIRTRKQDGVGTITLDAFHVIADWYHFALLELLMIDKTSQDFKYLGTRLGVDPLLVEQAVRRLCELGMLEKKANGQLLPTDDFTGVGGQVPSAAIRKFHRQILEKALTALEFQPMEDRQFSSTVMSVAKVELPQAKEMLNKFRRAFAKRFGESAVEKDAVYCLSLQFVNVLNEVES